MYSYIYVHTKVYTYTCTFIHVYTVRRLLKTVREFERFGWNRRSKITLAAGVGDFFSLLFIFLGRKCPDIVWPKKKNVKKLETSRFDAHAHVAR